MDNIAGVHNGFVDVSQGSLLPTAVPSLQVHISMPPPQQVGAQFVNAAGERHHESQQSVADAMLGSY